MISPAARRIAAATLSGFLLLVASCESAEPDRLLAPRAAAATSRTPAPAPVIVPGAALGAQSISTVLGSFTDGVLLSADAQNHVWNYYTFSASRAADGTARGTFRFVTAYPHAAVYLSGTITCYTVTGTQARIGGIVTASSFSEIPVGTAETWSITDNGAHDTGSSLLGGAPTYAQAYCDDGLPYAEHPYLAGGVTVTR